MILSDVEIKAALRERNIVIDPHPTEEQYTTSALDLILGNELFELKTPEELTQEEPKGVERPLIVNLAEVQDIRTLLHKYAKSVPTDADGSFLLAPQRFALGITRERVELPKQAKIAARVEGRSTLARLGLAVHLTAPTIHAGFHGQIVLEMFNFSPYSLRLTPGKLAVCQLIFERVGRIPKGPLKTTHLGQRSVR
ncbi:MAG: dCTP deaminase [Candidatus Binatia bacterium]